MLRKLFGTQPIRPASETDTVPSGAISIPFSNGQTRPSLRVSHAQSKGMVRRNNQDVLYSLTSTFEGDEPFSDFGLYIVADGMGGHNRGELASATAAKVLAHQVLSQIYVPLLEHGSTDVEIPVAEILESSLQAANFAVLKDVIDGGTTVTCALILNHRMFIGHVGDSRAYTIGQETLGQLTEDHSLVQRLQELGQITAEEAAVHPQRNVLYRAIGQGEGLEIDVFEPNLEVGEKILICSDGLWSLVSDEQAIEIIHRSADMQEACDKLVDAANLAGGTDNITVLIAEAIR